MQIKIAWHPGASHRTPPSLTVGQLLRINTKVSDAERAVKKVKPLLCPEGGRICGARGMHALGSKNTRLGHFRVCLKRIRLFQSLLRHWAGSRASRIRCIESVSFRSRVVESGLRTPLVRC